MSQRWRNRCKCPCGCERRCTRPYIECSYCAAGAHQLPPEQAFVIAIANGNRDDIERTACTADGQPFKSYELQPGTGLCDVHQA